MPGRLPDLSWSIRMSDAVTLLKGNCLHQMRSLAPESIDACVTDPPYGLSFMGRGWDHSVPGAEYWRGVFRVLKPGAYIVAFGGTRTYHRLACAIEDAGFEPRDMLAWLYGCGFPKSRNLDGEYDGLGTALKPALEPIAFMRKPLSEKTVAANVLRWGTGALNIDGCRVSTDDVAEVGKPSWGGPMKRLSGAPGQEGKLVPRTPPHNNGRWPANVVHDGSDEVVGAFPDSASGSGRRPDGATAMTFSGVTCGPRAQGFAGYVDAGKGSASRFFYSAKASKADRAGSKHPTVKRVDLMQWLCRLVTPKGGTVLDPFAGTGTTGEAAFREGFNTILIEREPEYQADIERRIANLKPQQERMFA